MRDIVLGGVLVADVVLAAGVEGGGIGLLAGAICTAVLFAISVFAVCRG